jgi:hypothetical protein
MFHSFFGFTRKLCENAIFGVCKDCQESIFARVACKYGFSMNDLVTLIQLLIHTEANLRETD